MKIFYIIFLSSCFSLFSCKKENRKDCIKSTGEIIIQERVTAHFDSILVHNNIILFLKHDTVRSIKIEAGQNLIPLIETKIENNQLIISNNNRCNFMRSYEPTINVTVSVPDLKHLQHTGSGDVKSINTLKVNRIRVVNSGVGDINLDLDAGNVFTQIYGSGGINLSGKAAVCEIYSTGNCFMHCENLFTGYTYIYSNTTGNIHVHAQKELGVTILGSGNVYYTGNPLITKQDISGKGSLYKQ